MCMAVFAFVDEHFKIFSVRNIDFRNSTVEKMIKKLPLFIGKQNMVVTLMGGHCGLLF